MESSVHAVREEMNNKTRAVPESWEGETVCVKACRTLNPQTVWTYGFLSVTATTVAAILGIVILPRISKRLYHRCLALFVGLGVGTLTGSAVFHLIPQVFERFLFASK